MRPSRAHSSVSTIAPIYILPLENRRLGEQFAATNHIVKKKKKHVEYVARNRPAAVCLDAAEKYLLQHGATLGPAIKGPKPLPQTLATAGLQCIFKVTACFSLSIAAGWRSEYVRIRHVRERSKHLTTHLFKLPQSLRVLTGLLDYMLACWHGKAPHCQTIHQPGLIPEQAGRPG